MSTSTESADSDILTNLARPKTSAVITVRIIKSFEYRTEKSLIFHDLDLESTTVGDLKQKALQSTYLHSHKLLFPPRSQLMWFSRSQS